MSKIITISLGPCWDVTCKGAGLAWGAHAKLQEQSRRPAGKALNVSRALAWMGTRTLAAGLWGQRDHVDMLAELAPLKKLIEPKLTVCPGRTRDNITVIDTARRRELHLRAADTLASRVSLPRLTRDLQRIIQPGDICVLAGSMPAPLGKDIRALVQGCQKAGAYMVVDTSGEPLRTLARQGGLWLMKPNGEELGELAGKKVADQTQALIRAAQAWRKKTDMMLISRGAKGVLLISRQGIWEAHCVEKRPVKTTVACGDYLLAGFLKGLVLGDLEQALTTAIVAATARAWGWSETRSWANAQRSIKVKLNRMDRMEFLWGKSSP